MGEKSISASQSLQIDELKKQVQLSFGARLSTPKDFLSLSESIYKVTGEMISPTTLKRLWGYLNEPLVPREATLNLLARYCGWSDFSHFCSGSAPDIESGNIGSQTLMPDRDLVPGDRLTLRWNPSRVCRIKYLGADKWEVEEAELTRLAPGDTFHCSIFVSGEPLYLDNLTREGRVLGTYICGRKTGITFIREE